MAGRSTEHQRRLDVWVDRGLVERLRAWQAGLQVPTTLTAAVSTVLEVGLSVVEAEKREAVLSKLRPVNFAACIQRSPRLARRRCSPAC
jgi:post-segregation antitoxin (ccd killing protein)